MGSLTSVIIVNYNGKAFIGELLHSLAKQTLPAHEVILVDNASTDGSADLVQETFPWVKIIRAPQNLGFGKANNLALESIQSEYIALLNSDATVDPNWLRELTQALDSHPSVAVTVPKIYRSFHLPELHAAGNVFNQLGHFWGRGLGKIDRGQYDQSMEVAGLTGCSALIRRSALQGEPLFDPDFFMYGEEFELSLRIRGRGWGIRYAPSAVVYHKEGQSARQVSSDLRVFHQFYWNQHRAKILSKYYPLSMLLTQGLWILLSLVYWNGYFFKKGKIRLLMRAMYGQVRFAIKGLLERNKARDIKSQKWLPWMMKQNIKEILRMKNLAESHRVNI